MKKTRLSLGGDSKMSFHYQTKVNQRGNPFDGFSTGNFKDMPFLQKKRGDY